MTRMKHKQKQTFNEMVSDMKHNAKWRNRIQDLLHHTPMGSGRRKQLGLMISGEVAIPVNFHYCRQIKFDKDMQQLIKRGTHKVISGSYGFWNQRRQYLVAIDFTGSPLAFQMYIH